MEHVVAAARAVQRPTAVLAATTTWQEFPALWSRLLDEVHAGVRWDGEARPGRNVMLYRDDVPNVEVGVELDKPAQLDGRLIRSELPAGEVAMTVHRGSYAGLAAAHEAVVRWCAEQGLRRAGPRWEIYGHWSEDPAQVETEVYYLLLD
jgi:effector-binding domain-containing protein